MAKQFRKQIKNHVITWSNREKRYIVKKGKRRVYDTETQRDAENWINRNA
jgi:hypothetical protein